MKGWGGVEVNSRQKGKQSTGSWGWGELGLVGGRVKASVLSPVCGGRGIV